MPRLSKKVWNRIKSEYDASIQAEIAESLDLYEDNERERVQLYILALANGNKDEVYRLVDNANQDYRNIIFWAENPEESRIDTPEKRQQMRELFQWLSVETPDELKETEK